MVNSNTSTQDAARESLRIIFPRNSTVTTIVRHVSKSGMSRAISVLATDVNGTIEDVSWIVARAGIFKSDTRHAGLKVSGTGMDMTFHVTYSIASVLYGDGYALKNNNV